MIVQAIRPISRVRFIIVYSDSIIVEVSMSKLVSMVILFLIGGTAIVDGQEWLSPRPYDNTAGSYFTDPFFYPLNSQAAKASYESQYYPYFGEDFFRTDTNPYQHSQESIAAQRQSFESPFTPYFGNAFLSWGENYPPNWNTYLAPTSGDTVVTIASQGMRGYQVYLDGNYIGTEGTGGDLLDGRFSFKVVGGHYHDIRVSDGQFNYPKRIFFQQGIQKIIYVEPEQLF